MKILLLGGYGAVGLVTAKILLDSRKIDFGSPFGRHQCHPFESSELASLPLKEMGVSGLGSYATSRDGAWKRITLGHVDPYVATSIPLAACLIQLIEDGLESRRGVHVMGHTLDSERFLREVNRLGLLIRVGSGKEV